MPCHLALWSTHAHGQQENVLAVGAALVDILQGLRRRAGYIAMAGVSGAIPNENTRRIMDNSPGSHLFGRVELHDGTYVPGEDRLPSSLPAGARAKAHILSIVHLLLCHRESGERRARSGEPTRWRRGEGTKRGKLVLVRGLPRPSHSGTS